MDMVRGGSVVVIPEKPILRRRHCLAVEEARIVVILGR